MTLTVGIALCRTAWVQKIKAASEQYIETEKKKREKAYQGTHWVLYFPLIPSHPPGYRGREFLEDVSVSFRSIASSDSSNQSVYFWPLCSQLVHRNAQE